MIKLAVVLARKNSKRLKGKNQLKIKGLSLVERTIHFANKLKFIDKILFSTDDKYEFKEKIKKLITIKRPQKLSLHNSKSEDAIIHAVKKIYKTNLKNILILLLQPTSPFRSKKMISNSFKYIKNKNDLSIISVSSTSNTKNTFFIEKGKLLKKEYNKTKTKKKYKANGNFYFANYSFLKKNRSFYLKNKTLPFIINNKKFKIDIDTKRDFELAKKYS